MIDFYQISYKKIQKTFFFLRYLSLWTIKYQEYSIIPMFYSVFGYVFNILYILVYNPL